MSYGMGEYKIKRGCDYINTQLNLTCILLLLRGNKVENCSIMVMVTVQGAENDQGGCGKPSKWRNKLDSRTKPYTVDATFISPDGKVRQTKKQNGIQTVCITSYTE